MWSKNDLKIKIKELGQWYQIFSFPNGASTSIAAARTGLDAEKRWRNMEKYIPNDLSGKTCLDLGGNSGYYSVQMAKRGAKCKLVEPFHIFVKQAELTAQEFGVDLEIIKNDAHIYCLTTEERFDYVIFVGLFYHLKYPGLVLDRLSEMTKKRIFIQSHIIGPYTEAEPKLDYENYEEDNLLEDPSYPKLAFIEHLYNHDKTNWWMPNMECLSSMIRSSGLKIIARPTKQMIVAEPEIYFGKIVYDKLVFPKYGKKRGKTWPLLEDPSNNSKF